MNITPDAHRETTRALERAVDLDPACAPAWAVLGGMYAIAYILGQAGFDDPIGQALDCVQRALRLDPLCQDAYTALAHIYFHLRDRDMVIRASHRALELNPNDATAAGAAGFFLALTGDEERGLAYLDKAIALNPFFPGFFHIPYFLHHFVRGEHEAAYVRAQRINMPEFFWDPLLRAVALSKMERIDEAQTAMAELLQLKSDFSERADHYLGTLVFADALRRQMLASLHEAGLLDLT
jgi:adenylate cyclase